MVQSFQITFEQILVLCFQIAAGFLFYKMRLIQGAAVTSLINTVIYLSLPCMLLTAFDMDLTPETMWSFFCGLFAAILCHVIAIVVSILCIRERKGYDRRVLIECCVFSNCGLFGLPLLSALMGSEGLFYGSPYNLVFGTLFWTGGVLYLKAGQGKVTAKKILLNPCNIALFIGFFLFFTQRTLPPILQKVTTQVGNMAVPLSMFIIGLNLARADLKSVVKNKYYWFVSFVRLVLIPAACVVVLYLIRIRGDLLAAVIISAATPAATTVAIIAEECNRDSVQASLVISLSTILSIVTLPAIVALAKCL